MCVSHAERPMPWTYPTAPARNWKSCSTSPVKHLAAPLAQLSLLAVTCSVSLTLVSKQKQTYSFTARQRKPKKKTSVKHSWQCFFFLSCRRCKCFLYPQFGSLQCQHGPGHLHQSEWGCSAGQSSVCLTTKFFILFLIYVLLSIPTSGNEAIAACFVITLELFFSSSCLFYFLSLGSDCHWGSKSPWHQPARSEVLRKPNAGTKLDRQTISVRAWHVGTGSCRRQSQPNSDQQLE